MQEKFRKMYRKFVRKLVDNREQMCYDDKNGFAEGWA